MVMRMRNTLVTEMLHAHTCIIYTAETEMDVKQDKTVFPRHMTSVKKIHIAKRHRIFSKQSAEW